MFHPFVMEDKSKQTTAVFTVNFPEMTFTMIKTLGADPEKYAKERRGRIISYKKKIRVGGMEGRRKLLISMQVSSSKERGVFYTTRTCRGRPAARC